MMNIIDFVKEFEFKKRRRLRSWGGCENMLRGVRIYAQGGAKAQGGAAHPPEKLRGVRPDRGAPPETATDHTNQYNRVN